MFNRDRFIGSLFNTTPADFNEKAMALFHYQAEHNTVYKKYLEYLGRSSTHITHYSQIPFLPIGFFKTHHIQTKQWEPEKIFSSSSTTGTGQSFHRVKCIRLYRDSFLTGFRMFVGPPESYIFCAVLPSYREREGSSLIYMVEELVRTSAHPLSGFYMHDAHLPATLEQLQKQAKSDNRTLLIWGVTFALLDLAEKASIELSDSIIMETGGMKGRRKEITRPELHTLLQSKLSPKSIYSEYGMTELLSQCYFTSHNVYQAPPWMKILIRNSSDPFEISEKTECSGAVNLIDLANIDSCAFIASDDIGRIHEKGFELNGRLDNSDIRGCNLLFT
jgi:hypothetical protein